MKKIELLAPAGSLESLYAAVQSGADAVYIGGSKFSARAYASNFDEENMTNAINYCHLYGVKVYITINTLLKQNELKEALEYIGFLYKIGVDAIIIQDTGLAYLVRNNFPELEIHASTQMTIHNGEGALFLRDLGFKRIVLSRELSLQEIKHISMDLGVETEIFIHGALCICYSGQCLMSSMIGGRSGNRGRCAQPCRLPYSLRDKISGRETSAYLLSPKDICTIEDIEKLIDSSTASLKIEGRMKRPEYVAGVVDAYRRAIDSIYEGKSFNFQEENKKLLKLFNREGFSKAYLFGNMGKDMMAYKFPKNTGIQLGKVLNNSLIELKEDISKGDGVRIGEAGFIIEKILKSDIEVEEAYIGDKIKLMPLKYKANDVLYKTSDVKLLKNLEGYYKNIFQRKINLNLSISFKVQEPLKLKTIFQGKEFAQHGDIVQLAIKKPLEQGKISENLKKSGDTPFKFEEIDFECYEEGFLPVSSINSTRRQLIEQIEKYINDTSKREFERELRYPESENTQNHTLENLVLISSADQLKAYKESGLDAAIAIDIFKKQSSLSFESVKELKMEKLYLKVPNIIKGEFENICNLIENNLPFIKGIVTANLGIIKKFSSKTFIVGDYKLNIYNNISLKFYEKYVRSTSISVELNKKELEEVIKNSNIPIQVKVYGKEELMVSEYCPIGSTFGGKGDGSLCKQDCTCGNYILKDRKDEEFTLRTDKFCRSYIYNGVATNLIPHIDELKRIGTASFRLDFIDESYEETMNILKAFKEGKWQGEYVNFTRGHYKRGVE